jgi:hypothetical protein
MDFSLPPGPDHSRSTEERKENRQAPEAVSQNTIAIATSTSNVMEPARAAPTTTVTGPTLTLATRAARTPPALDGAPPPRARPPHRDTDREPLYLECPAITTLHILYHVHLHLAHRGTHCAGRHTTGPHRALFSALTTHTRRCSASRAAHKSLEQVTTPLSRLCSLTVMSLESIRSAPPPAPRHRLLGADLGAIHPAASMNRMKGLLLHHLDQRPLILERS